MTKPITAVAALILWEQGGFELNDPVRAYIPSFERLRVWRGGSAVRPETEPVTEEMRVWHLFTHTSGLTYGFMQSHPVDALYRKAGFEWGVPTGLDLGRGVRPARRTATGVPARLGVELRHEHRRPGPGGGGGRGRAVRRLRAGARARSTGHERDDVARSARARRPVGRAVHTEPPDTAWRCASTPWVPQPSNRRRRRWVGAACAGRRATTSASPRCCAAVASSTASVCCRRAPSSTWPATTSQATPT